MMKKIVVCAILAMGVASAESYKVKFLQPSVVTGAELKAGEYRVNVENGKLTIVTGKQTVEAAVKVESVDKKFDTTSVRYAGQNSVSEIRVGGTKTKIVFNN
jgi:hypothetical protein